MPTLSIGHRFYVRKCVYTLVRNPHPVAQGKEGAVNCRLVAKVSKTGHVKDHTAIMVRTCIRPKRIIGNAQEPAHEPLW